MGVQTKPGSDGIICSSCGHLNPSWNISCDKCYKKLNASGISDLTNRRIMRSRPGCVTAYALLMFFGAGMIALAGIVITILFLAGGSSGGLNSLKLALGAQGERLGAIALIIVLIVSAVSIFINVVIGWGLWNLKNWARIIIIVLQGMGLCGNILSIIAPLISRSGTTGNPVISISASLFSLIISGIIIYWFSTNGDYFH